MNTEIGMMEATGSLKNLFRKARSEPFATFIGYPIEEIRDACIKGIEAYSNIGSGFADQAEAIIRRLKLVDWRENYWKKILEWYLFAAEDEPVLKRAIEFALSIYNEDRVLNDNLVSKFLAGRLKKGTFNIGMYDKVPSLKAFFHGFLQNIYLDRWTRKLHPGGYSESDWRLTVRALDVAVLAEDFSLLWNIQEAIMLIEEGVIFPDRDAHWSAKKANLAYLKSAENELEKAKQRAVGGEA